MICWQSNGWVLYRLGACLTKQTEPHECRSQHGSLSSTAEMRRPYSIHPSLSLPLYTPPSSIPQAIQNPSVFVLPLRNVLGLPDCPWLKPPQFEYRLNMQRLQNHENEILFSYCTWLVGIELTPKQKNLDEWQNNIILAHIWLKSSSTPQLWNKH